MNIKKTYKALALFLCMVCGCTMQFSCSSDDSAYEVKVSDGDLTFTPAMGGAIFHYKLPKDPDIIAVNLRYKDAYGSTLLKSGSNATDSLVITGFNEAVADVPVDITFTNKHREESAPIKAKFSTLDSAPICFINSVTVNSGWNGFSLSYNNPQGTKGMAHVYYLGNNPYSNKADTILLSSFQLNAGTDTLVYQVQQEHPYNTVIVRVEDYRGYIVKERVWEHIQAFNTEKLSPDHFEIIYNNSLEVPAEHVGLEYLTDGDCKGVRWFELQNAHVYNTFISKENGAGEDSEPMYVDLKTMRPTSEIRFYAHRQIASSGKPDWGPYNEANPYVATQYFNGFYPNVLPCSITIFGSREDDASRNWDSKTWEKIGEFDQDPDADYSARWTYRAANCGGTFGTYTFGTLARMEAATPVFMSIKVPAEGQDKGFRFLKIKFNNVFNLATDYERPSTTNKVTKIISFHELEIYSKKE